MEEMQTEVTSVLQRHRQKHHHVFLWSSSTTTTTTQLEININICDGDQRPGSTLHNSPRAPPPLPRLPIRTEPIRTIHGTPTAQVLLLTFTSTLV